MVDIGLDTQKSKEIVERLNVYLSNLNLLYVKLHNFHWNVVGIGFFTFHEKLEELYEFTAGELDRVAERIKMLGFYPLASMQEYLKTATLKEAESQDYNSSTIAKSVVNDYEKVVKDIRNIAQLAAENNDEYTIALLSEAIGFYEKNIWFFSAYLNRDNKKG